MEKYNGMTEEEYWFYMFGEDFMNSVNKGSLVTAADIMSDEELTLLVANEEIYLQEWRNSLSVQQIQNI